MLYSARCDEFKTKEGQQKGIAAIKKLELKDLLLLAEMVLIVAKLDRTWFSLCWCSRNNR